MTAGRICLDSTRDFARVSESRARAWKGQGGVPRPVGARVPGSMVLTSGLPWNCHLLSQPLKPFASLKCRGMGMLPGSLPGQSTCPPARVFNAENQRKRNFQLEVCLEREKASESYLPAEGMQRTEGKRKNE